VTTNTTKLNGSDDELRVAFGGLTSKRDVAGLLEVDYPVLAYHLYKSPRDSRYKTFNIPKKSGGLREITAPVTPLKIIQRKLNQVLQAVYRPRYSVHGFTRRKNVRTNAQQHSGQKYVFNIDLSDFFPSINFGRVRGLFMSGPFDHNAEVATILAQICCFDGRLPQGAPTSPVISNMICSKMDGELQQLAKTHRCYFTRYVDDMTFSTSLPYFPKQIGERVSQGGESSAIIGKEL
jgi:RNA-directed DNA polymerase